MNHVPVEVERNIKNAAVLMPEIFLIGKSVIKKDYRYNLTSKGYWIKSFPNLKTVLPKLKERPDLLIINGQENKDTIFKKFLALSKNIPKIIISDTHGIPKSLIKEPLTYSLLSPGQKELNFAVNRLLRERVLKQEMDLYEDINKDLASCKHFKDTLNIIIKKAKEVTKAEGWSVFWVDEETRELTTDIKKDKSVREVQKFSIKFGEGIAGWVAKEGFPTIVADVSKDNRFLKRVDRADSLKHKIKSILCVPIKSSGNLLAVLEFFNKTDGKSFTSEDLNELIKLTDKSAIYLENALLYQKVEELSVTDDLTKLFNQRYLHRAIEMEIHRALRYQTSIALIFMDIDYFKNINDKYGHLVGSKVLVEMGQLLIKNLRIVDIVVRYGGDEFVIILPHTPPVAAAQVAERIRKAVERNVFLKNEGYQIKITASFGVASCPENAKSKDELLRLADEAMYKVKYRTRNGVYALI
ncbi:MAG: sensor domain-containing diguanylate cyclase [Nitrospirae bacterium]|nr:sensor domain-containing diguanylate cyclase [Nitrospirota bacterium]